MTHIKQLPNIFNLSFGQNGSGVFRSPGLSVSVFHILRVVFVRTYFEMIDIATSAVIAFMSNYQAIRNGAVIILPNSTMSFNVFVFVPDRAIPAMEYSSEI